MVSALGQKDEDTLNKMPLGVLYLKLVEIANSEVVLTKLVDKLIGRLE